MLQGHLAKRYGKVWYLAVNLNGKKKWFRLGILSKHEAERARREKLTEIEHNHYKDLRKATFRQVADKWIAAKKTDGLKTRTIISYEERLKPILFEFGETPIQNITADKVEALKALLSEKVSPRSTNYCLWALYSVMEKAKAWGYAYNNPCELVSRAKSSKKQFKVFSKEEFHNLLRVCKGQERVFILLAGTLGLRLGELCALRWSCVDLDKGVIFVRESYSLQGGFESPKSQAGVRNIRLPLNLIQELKTHKAWQNQERLRQGPRWQDNDLVFAGEFGIPLEGSCIRKYFKEALLRAEIKGDYRLHDLRGTAASLALQAGVSPRDVQTMLGHSTCRLVLETYAKSTEESMKVTALKLEAYLLPANSL